jgi:tRNA pseudouridine55 synthase
MARRRKGLPVHGWLIFDKPQGMTSTQAVSRVKRLYDAAKAGHAGTLDPLATGVLPIALGEATKTVPFVVEGSKDYRFTVQFGAETDTDDAEGSVVATSGVRATSAEIEAALPHFTGEIIQVPPRFSALKVAGARAYDLAREKEEFELAPRRVSIARLELIAHPDQDHGVIEASCGKGTYVRALARDLGRALGTRGHVAALRRTAVGPFMADGAVTVDELTALARDGVLAAPILLPVAAGLAALPALAVSRADAARLARGQAVLLRGRDAPILQGVIAVSTQGELIALAEAEQGELRPRRIFNLGAQGTPAGL